MEESLAELRTDLEEMARRRGTTVDAESLRSLAARFASACKRTNARLDECFQLVSAGLRSEAVYLADSPPPLSDLVSVVDGPAAQEVRVMMQEAGLAVPPMVNADRLNVFEAAHATLNHLEPLMSEYRRLNLSGADTPSKMMVVRKLAKVDAGNPAWPADLRELELKRFREIHMILASNTRMSEAVLSSMVTDLENPANLAKPAADLVDRVRARYDALRKQRFDKDIATLTPLAMAAYQAMRVDQLDDLLREIDYHMETEQFEIPQPWAAQLPDAREWLAERLRIRANEKAFKKDCEILTRMLEAPTTGAALRQQREKVTGYGLDIPDELEIRARNTQAHVDAHERRKRAAIAFAGSLLVVILLGVLGVGIWWLQDRSSRNAFVSAVNTQIEAGKLAEAADLVAAAHRDHPRWFSAVAVQSAESGLLSSEQQQTARHRSFVSRLASLENTKPEDLNSPNTQAEYEGLARAASTPEEKESCAKVELAIDKRRQGRENDAEQQLGNILTDMQPLLAAGGSSEDSDKVESVIADCGKLLEQAHKIQVTSTDLQLQLAGYDKRYQELRLKASDLRRAEAQRAQDRKQDQQKHQADQQKLREARSRLPDNIPAYVDALANAHRASPDAFASTDKLLKFTDLYPPIIDVSHHAALVRIDERFPGLNLKADAIQSIWGKLAADENTVPSPYDASLKELRRRLKYAQGLPDAAKEFDELFSKNYYMSACVVLVEKPGSPQMCYFCPQDKPPVTDASGVHMFSFDGGNNLVQHIFSADTVVHKPELSPHSELFRRVQTGLTAESTLRGIDSQIPGMIKDVLASTEANARARRELLQRLIDLNKVAGSPAPFTEKAAGMFADMSDKIELKGAFAPHEVDRPDTNFTEASDALQMIASTLPDNQWKHQLTERRLKSGLLLQALYRPLSVTGVLVVEKTGGRTVEPVSQTKPAEYWAVVPSQTGPVFQIIAMRSPQGVMKFLSTDQPLPDGLPLLSPNDGIPTLGLLKETLGATPLPPAADLPSGWPVNLLQESEGR